MTMTQQTFMRTRPLTMAPSAFTSSAAWRSDYRAWTYKGVVPPSMLVPLYSIAEQPGMCTAWATSRAFLMADIGDREYFGPSAVMYSKINGQWVKTREIQSTPGTFGPAYCEWVGGKDYIVRRAVATITGSMALITEDAYRWDGTLMWSNPPYEHYSSSSRWNEYLFMPLSNYLFCLPRIETETDETTIIRLDPETGSEIARKSEYYKGPLGQSCIWLSELESMISGALYDVNLNIKVADLDGIPWCIGNSTFYSSAGVFDFSTGQANHVLDINWSTVPQWVLKDYPIRRDPFSYYNTIHERWYMAMASIEIPFANDDLLLFMMETGYCLRLRPNRETSKLDFVGQWGEWDINSALDSPNLRFRPVSLDGITWYIRFPHEAISSHAVYADLAYVNDQYLALHSAIAALL